MRRERRQHPLKRSTGSKQAASVSHREESASNFSLDSLKIKVQQLQPRPSRSSSFVLFVLFGSIVMIIVYLSPIRLWSLLLLSSSSLSKTSAPPPRDAMPRSKSGNTRQQPMLPKPGEYAPLRPNKIEPLIKLRRAPTPEYHIFSISSETDVAHNILTNILMGLFDQPDEHLGIVKWSSEGNHYLTRYQNKWVDNNVTIVSQTIDTDITHLQREFRSSYRNLFFFVVDRGQPECQTPHELIMMCISQADLLYHGVEEEKVVIGRILHRMRRELPYWSKVDFSHAQQEALRRLDCMADMQLQMQVMPEGSLETKYGIRGGTVM